MDFIKSLDLVPCSLLPSPSLGHPSPQRYGSFCGHSSRVLHPSPGCQHSASVRRHLTIPRRCPGQDSPVRTSPAININSLLHHGHTQTKTWRRQSQNYKISLVWVSPLLPLLDAVVIAVTSCCCCCRAGNPSLMLPLFSLLLLLLLLLLMLSPPLLLP